MNRKTTSNVVISMVCAALVLAALPVMAGDEISCRVQCLESRPSDSQPGCGVVTVFNELYNQRGELVYTAQCSFLAQRRPQS